MASFPVEETDQIMMTSDGGQLIRMAVDGIRVAGRSTQGVTLFRLDGDEKVVSVARVAEESDDEEGGEEGAADEATPDSGDDSGDNSADNQESGDN